ncbi:Ribbon-helix-helix protein, copG family [bacterium YEK0313]|nr:Ribbon-helix-helix protein, copG family [bacterium YEK0313]
MTAAFTVRIGDEIAEKLDRIAALSDRSRAYLAAQAIEDYVAREEWQLDEIRAGLNEADSNDFASGEELAEMVAKYVKPTHKP